MTMFVVGVQPDQAHIMNDSVAYRADHRHMWINDSPKVAVLPGLDAAVGSRGGVIPAALWRRVAASLADVVADFDEFSDRVPDQLQRMVEAIQRSRSPKLEKVDPTGDASIHAYWVGYSPSSERFRCYVASTEAGEDCRPTDITHEGLHVTPAPPGVRPSALEKRGFDAHLASGRIDVTLPSEGEVLDPPASVAGWVDLAKTIYRGRSVRKTRGLMEDPLKICVGGPVRLTHLTRGHATQEVIHTFTRDDFYAMNVHSFHPIGQLGPCPCESGVRYLDCHIAQWRKLSCHCYSGKAMEDCCMLDITSVEACQTLADYPELAAYARTPTTRPAAAGKVARNGPCPCGSGTKYKKCCQLVSA